MFLDPFLLETAKEGLDHGVVPDVSFSTHARLESSRGRSIVSSIPATRVLTESDGPFAKSRGSPLRPVKIIDVVQELSSIWKMEQEEARSLVMDNVRRCVSRRESKKTN